jgi:hypothetical protein
MPREKPKFAAFDQGQSIAVAVVNQARSPLGVDLDVLVAALQTQVTRDFAPKWGITCKVQKATSIPKGAWAIVILDDPDEPNAAGYHDLTPDGLPLSKVFVAAGDVSVTASHELLEMLVDPAINSGCQQADQKTWVALEVCDAVEETTYKIDGVTAVSNFVFPSYFESFRKANSGKFDFLGLVKKPFQILKGGYLPVFKNGRWTQVFGSEAKRKRFAREDRRGHRTESRGKELKRGRITASKQS